MARGTVCSTLLFFTLWANTSGAADSTAHSIAIIVTGLASRMLQPAIDSFGEKVVSAQAGYGHRVDIFSVLQVCKARDCVLYMC